MDLNFCPECGNKLEKDSLFCSKCGFKVKEEENKTIFCFNCGKKVDVNAEICPYCGVRIKNSITTSAEDALKIGKDKASKASNVLTKYVTARNVIIVAVILIIICLAAYSPKIIDHMTPYKQVDSSYFPNHVAGEKVQFDGEYMGTTSWYSAPFLTITNNDIVKVDDQYVILQGDYLGHDLYGHEGSTVHLEGRFAQGGLSNQPFGDGHIDGYWFGADKIELVD